MRTETPPIMLHLCYTSIIFGDSPELLMSRNPLPNIELQLPKPGLEPGRGYPPEDFQ